MNTLRTTRLPSRPGARTAAVAALTVALAAVLAGCGAADDTKGTDVASPSASSPTDDPAATSPLPSPSASVPSPTPTDKPAGARQVTVRGMVSAGVEPGCLLLTAEPGGAYQLIGGDRSVLRPGRMVEVAGVLEPGLLTTCQQGMPLKVSRARAL